MKNAGPGSGQILLAACTEVIQALCPLISSVPKLYNGTKAASTDWLLAELLGLDLSHG